MIHHSRPTHDSRTGLLSVHFLETSKCDCKKFYHGEHDKLVRTSLAPSKSRSNVQFVSVDLLNEYMTSLFGKSQEGKSIDAFVHNKNILNCDERGEISISKQRCAAVVFTSAALRQSCPCTGARHHLPLPHVWTLCQTTVCLVSSLNLMP